MLNHHARKPARILGLAGALPFVSLTVALHAGHLPKEWVAHAQIAYAATIVSFIGALHWGLAMRADALDERAQWRALGWGVMPSLIAWGALMLPARSGLYLLAGLVPLCGWMDLRLARALGLESWFVELRTVLTVVVTLCLALSAFALT